MPLASRCALALSLLVPVVVVASCIGDEGVAPVCETTPCAFEGLSAPVDVRRDDSGMVHVYAQTDADALFGSGYMQAHERLFQMELTRRRALGRSSEVFGIGRLGDDKLIRTVDIPRWGRENAALTRREQPAIHTLAEAWTAGVNRFVDEVVSGERPLPAGFAEQGIAPERWEVSDSFAVGKLLLFGNANQIEFELLTSAIEKFRPEAFERIPALAPLLESFITPVDSPALDLERWGAEGGGSVDRRGAPPAPELPADAAARLAAFTADMERFRPGGSNNWAVDGAHTGTGLPMIAGDPHQGLSSPTILWAHHVNSADAGGTLDVAGWSFVGTPGIQLGHNRHIAWTATTNYPDTMDLYDVARSVDDAVTVAGQSIPMVAREEIIAVKDGPAETFVVWEVPGRGVLLPDGLLPLPLVDAGHAVMLAWPGLQPTHEFSSFFQLDTATSLEEFEAAVDGMEIGCFNFVAASAEGIAYRSSPLVPDRGTPTGRIQPFKMMDGADPATAWTGAYLPPEKMPRSRGNARGFIATSNNDPFGFTRDGALEGDPWYFGVYFDPGARQTRIAERLERAIDDGAVSLDDMKSIQLDVGSMLAVELVPDVAAVWSESPQGDEAKAIRARTDVARVVDLLEGWDRAMSRAQTAPVVFTALSHFLTRGAVSDDLAIFFQPIADKEPIYALKLGLLALRHPGGGAVEEGRSIVVLRALAETTDWLLGRFGSIDDVPSWGELHGSRFGSVGGPSLDSGWIGTDGGDGTVNVSTARFLGEGNGETARLESRGGAVYRMVAAIGPDGVPQAEFNMPRGLSGDPASAHWDDLEDDWVEGKYRPLLFADAAIEAQTVERITIAP